MKKYFFLPLLLICSISFANDGVFYATGNTLVPLKENTVQLKKEILNLTRKAEWMQVDIYFEFFNPGPEKELLVGFVTPPANGDVTDEEARHPFIKDFMVMSGDELLSYKVAKMGETGFRVSSKLAEGYDFVYYFTIKFKKGINVIRHSYQYRGGGSVEASQDFDYRLTTGTTWANHAIDDFELNIDMGENSYFSIPASFGAQPVNWLMTGVGRISAPDFTLPYVNEGKAKLKMVLQRRGRLHMRMNGFKPTTDLSVSFWNLHNEIGLWCAPPVKNDFSNMMEMIWGDAVDSTIRQFSDQQLRLYRNLNYARHGYAFKDETLKKAYSKYIWYIPDPAVKTDNTPDYYVSPELMQLIITEENRRKLK